MNGFLFWKRFTFCRCIPIILFFFICAVFRPVTVWWNWTTWMAGWKSSTQTDWSACLGRSGSFQLWVFPSQPRYSRQQIQQTNFTGKQLSWNRWEWRERHNVSCSLCLCDYSKLLHVGTVTKYYCVVGGPFLQHHWPADDSLPETHDAKSCSGFWTSHQGTTFFWKK